MPGYNFAHVQDDVNPLVLCMFEDTFSHDAAHLFVFFLHWQFWFRAFVSMLDIKENLSATPDSIHIYLLFSRQLPLIELTATFYSADSYI